MPKFTAQHAVFNAFHAYNLHRRFLRLEYPVRGLGPAEAQSLVELSAAPGMTRKQLAAVVDVDPSTASRTIGSLHRKGLVASLGNKIDRRESHLELTPRGRKVLSQLQTAQSEISKQCVKDFTRSEQVEFERGLARLADFLVAPATTKLPGDHPLTIGTVRLAKAFGMASDEILGISGLGFVKYSILRQAEIFEHQTELGEFSRMLPFERSILSNSAKVLARSGQLSRTKDGRRIFLGLTATGRSLLRKVSKRAAERLTSVRLSEIGHRRLVEFLERAAWTGPVGAARGTKFRINTLLTESDRKNGRGFAVLHLVREGRHDEIPDDFLSKKNRLATLSADGEIKAICELKQVRNGYEPLFVIGPRLSNFQLRQFLTAVSEMPEERFTRN